MKQDHRHRISVVLDELSKLHPEWRFGQLVANVAMWANGPGAEAIWDVEDETFLRAAEEHIRDYAAPLTTDRKKAV